MTKQASSVRPAPLLLGLWCCGLVLAALALWTDFGSPIAPWRRVVATLQLVVACGGTLACLFRARLRLSFRTKSLAALLSVIPAMGACWLLQTPDGNHLATSYIQARQMVSELESLSTASVDSYLQWHNKWQVNRANYEAWFPSISKRMSAANAAAADMLAGNLIAQASKRPEEAINTIDLVSACVKNEHIQARLSPVRTLAEYRTSVGDQRHSNQALVAVERYEEALSAAERWTEPFRKDFRALGIEQELDAFMDECKFLADIHRLTKDPEAPSESVESVKSSVSTD